MQSGVLRPKQRSQEGGLTRGRHRLGSRGCSPGVSGFPSAGGWLLRGGPGVRALGSRVCAGSSGCPPGVDRGGWLGTCGEVGLARRCPLKGLAAQVRGGGPALGGRSTQGERATEPASRPVWLGEHRAHTWVPPQQLSGYGQALP